MASSSDEDDRGLEITTIDSRNMDIESENEGLEVEDAKTGRGLYESESSGIQYERSIDQPIPPLNCNTIKDKKKCFVLCHTIATLFETVSFIVFLIVFCTIFVLQLIRC